jgi:hypothetical protein
MTAARNLQLSAEHKNKKHGECVKFVYFARLEIFTATKIQVVIFGL